MTATALLINVQKREITRVTYDDHDDQIKDLRRYVGGGIALEAFWPNGDVLFVNTDFMRDACEHFFILGPPGSDTPIGSNGLVVGRERHGGGSDPVRMSLEEAKALFRFMDRAQADSFMLDTGSMPAASINGVVIQTRAQFWAEMPRPLSTNGGKQS